MALPPELMSLFDTQPTDSMQMDSSQNGQFDSAPIGNQVRPESPQDTQLAQLLLSMSNAEATNKMKDANQTSQTINDNSKKGVYGDGNNITSTVLPDGSVSIEGKGPNPSSSIMGLAGKDPQDALTITNIDDRLRAIREETDPTQRAILLGNLGADANTLKIGITDAARQAAYRANNVIGLETDLKISQDRDSLLSLSTGQQLGESPQTKQLRTQLEQAKGLSEKMVDMSLTGNVTLASIDAKLKVVPTLFNQAAAADEKKQNKEDLLQQKKDNLLAETPEYVVDRAKFLYGINDPASAAEYAQKGTKNPDQKTALYAPTEQLPDLAFVQGNVTAKALLVQEEARDTNRPVQEVEADVKGLESLMNDNNAIKRMARRIYGNDKAMLEQVNSAFSTGQLATNKEQKAEANKIKFNIATQLIAQKKQQEFVGDVGTWGLVDGELNKAIQATQALGLPPTMENVAKQYAGNVPTQRAQKVGEFQKLIRQAGSKYSNSNLFAIDANILANQVPGYFVRSTVQSVYDKLSDSKLLGTDASFPFTFN